MYKVTIYDGPDDAIGTVIHSSYVNDIKLPAGTIKKEINKIDSFSFTIYPNNPGFGKLKPLKTLIKAFNLNTRKYDFEGRILGPNKDMDSSGLHSESYDCEGELGYLHDSMQKYREFRGTPEQLLRDIINYHNSQVEDYKKFEVGIVTVTDPNDYMYLYTSAEKDTFDTIQEELINRLGGELQIRKVNGVRFLDYLQRIGEDKSTEIRIAKNLISLTVNVDPTQIISRLTPLGATIESEDETATDTSPPRLTIESVNNGIPYIDDEALIAEFGIQGGSVVWDDVTLPENLLAKGKEWLANQKTAQVQYQLSAVDLSLIGLDIDSFDIGNSYPIKNPIMGINERLRVIGKSLDLNSPQDASLTIGDKFKTLNEYQKDLNKSAQQVLELQSTINRQSQTISSLKTELSSVNNAVETIQQTLDENDIPALEQAIQDLEEAINNLNQAIENIPEYGLATPTAEGLMSSADKTKLDRITVTNPVDLDDLVARVVALENQ